jgi:hypothetical protein
MDPMGMILMVIREGRSKKFRGGANGIPILSGQGARFELGLFPIMKILKMGEVN